jgi:hypothetical protein
MPQAADPGSGCRPIDQATEHRASRIFTTLPGAPNRCAKLTRQNNVQQRLFALESAHQRISIAAGKRARLNELPCCA